MSHLTGSYWRPVCKRFSCVCVCLCMTLSSLCVLEFIMSLCVCFCLMICTIHLFQTSARTPPVMFRAELGIGEPVLSDIRRYPFPTICPLILFFFPPSVHTPSPGSVSIILLDIKEIYQHNNYEAIKSASGLAQLGCSHTGLYTHTFT